MNERAIFIEALDRDTPGDRAAYLDEACDGDPALRERVEKFFTPEQLTKWDAEVTKAKEFLGERLDS